MGLKLFLNHKNVSLKEFSRRLIELIDFDVVFVVVGHEKLQKSVIVEVISSH